VGRTTQKTTKREDFLDIRVVLEELKERLARSIRADYVTLGGAGEPTLHLRLGELIDGIRSLTDIPIALLTNGTLLHREDVRADCSRADVVLPSLDAGDAAVFEAVNRPARGISIEKLVSGLVQFRREFTGQVWLEVFLIPSLNMDDSQIGKIAGLIERIRPDRIHLNTAVRPAADREIVAASQARLLEIARRLGPTCEVVGTGPSAGSGDCRAELAAADVLSMLKRRPCSIPDICAGLEIPRNEAVKQVSFLREAGLVSTERRGERVYFCFRREPS
jgi:wyosine [tRNA(Phe)-imidazoG37] synthetase (radical SAM superfamily)